MKSSEKSLSDRGRPLKVLHIATAFAHEGAPHITPWLTRTLKALRELGVDARVLTSSYRGMGDGEYEGIPVYRFRYSPAFLEDLTHDVAIYERLRLQKWRYLQLPLFMLGGILKAFKVERDFKPDIVHIHWPIPNVIWGLPFSGRKVLHCHSTGLTLVRKLKLLKVFLGPLIRRADFMVFNSSFSREDFLRVMGNVEVPSEIIPMPVSFKPLFERRETPSANRVLFVGRNVYWKGVDILIRAIHILNKKGKKVRLVVVGEGPEQKNWRNLAKNLGVEVLFRGWISQKELSREYATASVLVLPSRAVPDGWTEGLGVVLVEAMMHGTPVIASRAGGPLDVIKEGENGFFFELENAEDLAEKLERVLEDESLRERLGRRGREMAKRYVPERVAREFLRIYNLGLDFGTPYTEAST